MYIFTDDPEKELQLGLNLLEPIVDKIITVDDLFEPTNLDEDKVFISKSYDASTHFETTCDDILDIYQRVTGSYLVLLIFCSLIFKSNLTQKMVNLL